MSPDEAVGGSTGGAAGRGVLADDDLRVLVGVIAWAEMALVVDEPAQIMGNLLERLRRDLVRSGLSRSAGQSDVIEAVQRLNRRLRLALGEHLP